MISSAVVRGSTASNSPASIPSRKISSTTLRRAVLVGANMVPVLLDRDQHDVVDALLGEQIFLVVGQNFEDQPLEPLGGGRLGARNRPGSFLDL